MKKKARFFANLIAGCAFVIGVMLIAYGFSPKEASIMPPAVVTDEGVVVKMTAQDTFHIQVRFNGHMLPMIIDPGSVFTVITEEDAEPIEGMTVFGEVNLVTASGVVVKGSKVLIARVEIGPILAENVVVAMVRDKNFPTLLGMSFLKHIQWRYGEGRMILSQ
ncbi:MAG: retropepsin-like aspartic protease [bacterium]|nr:retropepsin-like aspartic protease [bacterium]